IPIQTLNEQIQERRKFLTTELPRQLPELEEQLEQINQQLSSPFGNEQVNYFRDLCEEQTRVLQRIQDIKSGTILQSFEEYVSRIQQQQQQQQKYAQQQQHQQQQTHLTSSSMSSMPVSRTSAFVHQPVSSATAVALASVLADEQ